MSELKIDNESLNEVIRKFKGKGLMMIAKAGLELETGGLNIIREAKHNVPQKTGDLKGSLTVLSRRSDGLGIKVGSDLNYAAKQEFIESYTHRVGGAHFLGNAFEKERPKIIKKLQNILDGKD